MMESQKVSTCRYLTRLIVPPGSYGKRWHPGERNKAIRDYKGGDGALNEPATSSSVDQRVDLGRRRN